MIICLDVDGTLQSAGGIIRRQEIEALPIGAVWCILSSRSRVRSMDACAEMGVSPSFIECCRVNQRAEELREIWLYHEQVDILSDKRRGAEWKAAIRECQELREIGLNHPIQGDFIYVANRERDKEEAQKAGWDFIFASEFSTWLEHFTSVATQ